MFRRVVASIVMFSLFVADLSAVAARPRGGRKRSARAKNVRAANTTAAERVVSAEVTARSGENAGEAAVLPVAENGAVVADVPGAAAEAAAGATAETTDSSDFVGKLRARLDEARNTCTGISKELDTIKALAGVSTGTAGVGTLAAGGALAVGVVKAKTDKTVEADKKSLEVKGEIEKKEYNRREYYNKNFVSNDLRDDFIRYQKEHSKVLKGEKTNNIKEDLQAFIKGRQAILKQLPDLENKYRTKWKEYVAIQDRIEEAVEESPEIKQLLKEKYELEKPFYEEHKDDVVAVKFSLGNLSDKDREKYESIESRINNVIKSDQKECLAKYKEVALIIRELNRLNLEYRHYFSTFADGKYNNNELFTVDQSCRFNEFDVRKCNCGTSICETFLYKLPDLNFEGCFTGVATWDLVEDSREIINPTVYDEPDTDPLSFYERYRNVESARWEDSIRIYHELGGDVDNDPYTQNKKEVPIERKKRLEKMDEEIEKLKAKDIHADLEYTEVAGMVEEGEAKSKTLGNVRTGLLVGAGVGEAASAVTSGISAAKLNALISQMEECNAKVRELQYAYNEAVANDVSSVDTTVQRVRDTLSDCTPFDIANMKGVKGALIGSTVAGGVGTATAVTGAVTSAMANLDKNRSDELGAYSDKDGKTSTKINAKAKQKEKGLNLMSNIMAGVTAGTGAAGVALSAVALGKLKKDSETAQKCEAALK